MVKLCNDIYPLVNEIKYKEYFNKFPFELSDFQKYAIEAIIEGNHILVTAHTGSGKTLPAEFAIEYFKNKGKKVIYTSPIKALSNQKFHEFSKKFPNISFGILTGDIKFNPEADVLIMTTEILRNNLLHFEIQKETLISQPLDFNLDFQNELGAVIFDEIHYINDMDRGKIWEETIMLLPNKIQQIMLSATIDKSEKFASWIEQVKNDEENGENNKVNEKNKKIVYLAPTNHRVVPLKHFIYTTITDGSLKNIKDKALVNYFKEFMYRPLMIKESSKKFYDENYEKSKKILDHINKNKISIKPGFILNKITNYLKENEMLPAIYFVFSRKKVEYYAKMITISLFEEDSVVPSIIKKECETILRKLPNFNEYIELPEFEFIISLLEKGIAVHHSGILPIFREMIELIFAKGYIKVLFATETFAVGINMPTKTVVFTGLEKFDGTNMRYLLPHEYTQMAGRAGRRGLDNIGYVIHLNNLFNLPYITSYRQLLNGNPQTLQSKFQINYNLLLNFIQFNKNMEYFVNKSMSNEELQLYIKQKELEYDQITLEYSKKIENPIYKKIIENRNKYEEYYKLLDGLKNGKQKIRKQNQKIINNILSSDKYFKNELEQYDSLSNIEKELLMQKQNIEHQKMYFKNEENNIIDFLRFFDFITKQNDILKINEKGIISTYIQETHSLAFSCFLKTENFMEKLNEIELVAILSCFSNIKVNEQVKIFNVVSLTENKNLNHSLMKLKEIYENFETEECRYQIFSGDLLQLNFELVNAILKWCKSENQSECKKIINDLNEEFDIFQGEFIKSILKINNMVNELSKIAEYLQNIPLLDKLKKIPDLILKFTATNQSLYV